MVERGASTPVSILGSEDGAGQSREPSVCERVVPIAEPFLDDAPHRIENPIARFIDEEILERLRHHGITFLRDGAVVASGYILAEAVHFDGPIPTGDSQDLVFALPAVIFIHLSFIWRFGVHRLWQYAGMRGVRAVLHACILSALAVAILDLGVPDWRPLPLLAVPMGSALALLGLAAVRVWRDLVHIRARTNTGWERVPVAGAGPAGQLVVADLLGNPEWQQYPVAVLNDPIVQRGIGDRVVLVTGARGSIGFEICRQVLRLNPMCVLALDNNETGLFYLQRELSNEPNGALLKPVLADITDQAKLAQIFERYRPDIVFHAAAYKHMPMLEASIAVLTAAAARDDTETLYALLARAAEGENLGIMGGRLRYGHTESAG